MSLLNWLAKKWSAFSSWKSHHALGTILTIAGIVVAMFCAWIAFNAWQHPVSPLHETQQTKEPRLKVSFERFVAPAGLAIRQADDILSHLRGYDNNPTSFWTEIDEILENSGAYKLSDQEISLTALGVLNRILLVDDLKILQQKTIQPADREKLLKDVRDTLEEIFSKEHDSSWTSQTGNEIIEVTRKKMNELPRHLAEDEGISRLRIENPSTSVVHEVAVRADYARYFVVNKNGDDTHMEFKPYTGTISIGEVLPNDVVNVLVWSDPYHIDASIQVTSEDGLEKLSRVPLSFPHSTP